ncbi:MAG: AAA family ATPase [Candidatus Aenigmatarchaeota archaeon]
MCVSPDTPVFLNNRGVTQIGDIFNMGHEKTCIENRTAVKIKEPIKIFSVNNELNIEPDEIEYVIEVPVKSYYKVGIENGSELKVSENQPFLTIDSNGNIFWKKSSELKIGDFVAAAKRIRMDGVPQNIDWYNKLNGEFTYVFENNKIVKLKDFKGNLENVKVGFARNKSNINKIKPIILPLKSTKNLLGFLGLMFSEGSINDSEISIANKDEKIRERAKEYFVEIFGFDEKNVYYDEEKIKVYSYILAEFLEKCCGLPQGKKPDNIHLPFWIFKCSREEIIEFLRMYFEGDGSVGWNQYGVPTFKYYSKNKNFLLGIQFLLLRLDISSKIIKWKTKRNELWALYIDNSKSRELFFKLISPKKCKERLKSYYNSKSKEDPNWLPINGLLKKIKEIENIKYGKDIPENSIEPYLSGRKILTFRQAKKILDLLSPLVKTSYGLELIKKARRMIDSDVAWKKVTAVELINQPFTLYDLTVKKNSNFLVGDSLLFLHNSMWYGKSEENLRKIFEEAEKNAPSIIFIDEVDSIAPKREEVTGEVERRVVSTLLTQMDGLKKRGKVIVIAATNRENSIDPALRRPGRFDREIEIGVPDKKGRKEILQIHTRHMPLSKDVNLDELAEITYGYVGADLEALAKEAAMYALRRILPEIKWKEEGQLPEDVLEKLIVTNEDFQNALKIVEPSGMREVLIEVPNVRWEDIGGLEEVKQELQEAIEWPLKSPEMFERLGITPPKGVLLYGPPGCGKTLLAKAVATESNANFISVKGPEIFSKWVGESEKRIRELFRRAKQVSPSIIFFDEIDSLVPKRGTSIGEDVSEKVVSQMLTELSGLEDLHNVVVIAATNRPDMLDPALLRPGRFDRKILVPGPDEKARLKILEIKTKKMPLKDVDLKKLAKDTEGFSGADLEALVREAAMHALRKNKKTKNVTGKDFEEAMKSIKPSLNKDVMRFYQQFDERTRKKLTSFDESEELKYVG